MSSYIFERMCISMSEFTPRGQGNLNTVLGAVGTVGALGLMGGGCGNNGLFGGLFGNRGGCCSDDQCVTRYEARKDAEIAAKDTEISLLKANIFTDQKITDVFDRLSTRIKGVEDVVNQTVCAQAVTNQKLSDNITFVDSKFDGVYKDIACATDKLRCYVDATFVPGKLVMPLDAICPEAMPKCQSTGTGTATASK